MADDTVALRFGAHVEELLHGIEQINEKLRGLGESARSLAELFGIAFTADRIVEFIKSMGDLGTNTERSMAILGISAEKIGELQGIAKLTGTSFEAMESSIGRMSLRMQESQHDAFNPTAEGLKALGLNAREFIGIPFDQYMLKLAEAFGKIKPSINTTAAAQAAFSRGITNQLPLLIQGRAHFEDMQRAVAATGSELTGPAAHAFSETGDKVTLLGLTMQGLGIKIFTVMRPAVDKAVESLTNMVRSITGDDIEAAARKIGATMINIGEQIALFFIGVNEVIQKIIATMRSDFTPQLGAFAQFVVGSLGKALEIFMVGLNQMVTTVTGTRPALNVYGKAIDEITASTERYRNKAEAAAEAARKMLAELLAPSEQISETGEKKRDVGAMGTGGKDALAAQMEGIQERIKLSGMAYQRYVEQLDTELKVFSITESEKTRLQIEAINNRVAAEKHYVDEQLALYGLTKEKRQQLQGELTMIDAKGAADRQKVADKLTVDQVKEWDTSLGQIQSAWDSQLKGLLAKTTTWKEAMRSIMAELIMVIIKEFEKIVIVENLAKAMKSLFGGFDLTGIFKAIAANIALTYTAAAAYLMPTLGPIGAPIAAAALAGTVGAVAGAFIAAPLPGAEGGAWNIPANSPWLLHQGETVLPAKAAETFRNMASGGGGGGGGVHFHINAMDGASVLRTVTTHADTFARVIGKHMGANPSSHG